MKNKESYEQIDDAHDELDTDNSNSVLFYAAVASQNNTSLETEGRNEEEVINTSKFDESNSVDVFNLETKTRS